MSVPSFSRLYCALGRHRLATLLGNHVGAIELEFGKVESFLYRGNTVDPDARETAIFAPLAEMVDRIMANHFAIGMLRVVLDRQGFPLAAGIQAIENRIEDFGHLRSSVES